MIITILIIILKIDSWVFAVLGGKGKIRTETAPISLCVPHLGKVLLISFRCLFYGNPLLFILCSFFHNIDSIDWAQYHN